MGVTQGFKHEINFWKSFVKTERFLDGWCNNTKTPELHQVVYGLLKMKPDAKVLDCGSGVVSILTGTVPNENLIVCDTLGDEYAKFFDYTKYDVVPPQSISCEDLQFSETFDLVHISNALDHTQDPVKSFENLFHAVKPGGKLIVQGFENEGMHENWQGLHQWNLSISGYCLVVNNKKGHITAFEGDYAMITRIPELMKDWFIFVKNKYEEFIPLSEGGS